MQEWQQLLDYAGKLSPTGFAFLNVVVLFWLHSRIVTLENESDDKARRGK